MTRMLAKFHGNQRNQRDLGLICWIILRCQANYNN